MAWLNWNPFSAMEALFLVQALKAGQVSMYFASG